MSRDNGSRIFGNALHVALRSSVYTLTSVLSTDWLQWSRSCRVIKEVLERLAVNCVLDVGANRGQYGSLLRRIGYTGWILSFEPVQSNLQVLEEVAKRHSPWRVFPFALGSVNGQLDINVAEMSELSSFLTRNEELQDRFPKNCADRKERVTIRRLDDVIETCLSGIQSPRIYLKMDTQGFDLEVVKGAESVLANVLALQTEISFKSIYHQMPGFMESLKEVQKRGFEVVDFLPVASDLDQLSAIEMDCIMVRGAK
jgi:FkbM family methyltransferase